MADEADLSVLNAVLRIAARHANLLGPGAFAELARTLAGFLAFDRITVLVPDGPLSLRVSAVSRRDQGWTTVDDEEASSVVLPGEPTVRFGARVPGVGAVLRRVIQEQRPHYDDDMLEGGDVERFVARGGMRSYAAYPARNGGEVVAILAFGCAAPCAARAIPAALAQTIADAIGPSIARALDGSREHRLAMILDTSGDALLAWDRNGLVTDANGAAAALVGCSHGELIGTPIRDLLGPLPSPGHGTPPGGVRLTLIAEGSRKIPVAATITSVAHDARVAAHALLRDLTEVVRAEQEAAARVARIHELEQQHRALLDSVPLIIFRLDPGTGELVYLNRQAERLLGVPTPEALATPSFLRAAHADPQGQAAFDAAVARARAGALSLPYEANLLKRNGTEITARCTIYPLFGDGGRVVTVEGVLTDVSAEHAARTRLVQADRLATLGTVASGVAHEINNPAAFILLGLDMLGRTLSAPGVELPPAAADSANETLRELRESIRRIVDITRDLRVLATPPTPAGAPGTIVDVNRTVESALSLTRGQILERAQIERHLDEVPPVLMDDGRLGQVIVNLLVNAAQAMPRSYAGENLITVSTRSDGWTVEIEVKDTGTGIAPEHLHRIWQPFFSTKGPEVGTGLGLSIGREIIERAGGTIVVESPAPGTDPPRGARFVITLPAAGNDEPTIPRSSPLPGTMAGPARVLVVDDEAPLARALAEEIGRHHSVVVVPSAEAALAKLAERRFDVVLCDLRMPGMNGEELFARVQEKDPSQARAFVFMTGVGFGIDVERFLAASGRPMLEKPFPAEAALSAIARVVKNRSMFAVG